MGEFINGNSQKPYGKTKKKDNESLLRLSLPRWASIGSCTLLFPVGACYMLARGFVMHTGNETATAVSQASGSILFLMLFTLPSFLFAAWGTNAQNRSNRYFLYTAAALSVILPLLLLQRFLA